jgi:hypothetical protein
MSAECTERLLRKGRWRFADRTGSRTRQTPRTPSGENHFESAEKQGRTAGSGNGIPIERHHPADENRCASGRLSLRRKKFNQRFRSVDQPARQRGGETFVMMPALAGTLVRFRRIAICHQRPKTLPGANDENINRGKRTLRMNEQTRSPDDVLKRMRMSVRMIEVLTLSFAGRSCRGRVVRMSPWTVNVRTSFTSVFHPMMQPRAEAHCPGERQAEDQIRGDKIPDSQLQGFANTLPRRPPMTIADFHFTTSYACRELSDAV